MPDTLTPAELTRLRRIEAAAREVDRTWTGQIAPAPVGNEPQPDSWTHYVSGVRLSLLRAALSEEQWTDPKG